MTRRAAIYLFLTAILAGCRDQEIAWNFSIDPELGDTVFGILANVREGSCEGELLVAYRFKRNDPRPEPSALDPGTFGFEVEAYDRQCQRIGVGCEAVVLPPSESGTEAIDIRVDALKEAEPSECTDVCDEGICVRLDAGT